ncbi:hypothetical protein [Flavobacterium sp. WV_118_3]|uniref:hypothetical protein n=1 Tax=Flavobacterium sp. WV_118_3 TaxID=3151764 RepID=UPI003219AA56
MIIALAINILSHFIGTDFLLEYLKGNLTTVQLGLMAINTATCGLVVSKLQEIKDKYKSLDIKPITKQLLLSLKEQIILIIVGVIILLLINSDIFNTLTYCEYIKFGLNNLLIAVFINSVQVLWDTGKSIFVLTDIMDEIGKNE